MQYSKIIIPTSEQETQEILTAYLAEYYFDSFDSDFKLLFL